MSQVVDISKIGLSGDEIKMLLHIRDHGPVSLSSMHESPIITTLFHRQLLELTFSEQFPQRSIGTVPFICNAVQINDSGRQYLNRYNEAKKERSAEWIRYIITTFIAILALILSAIALGSELGLIQLVPT